MHNNEQSLKQALNAYLEAYNLKGKMRAKDIEKNWKELMGPMIAKHTTKIYMHKHTLVVKFDSSALKHEVSMMKSKVIEMLNDYLGEKYIIDLKIL